LEVLLPNFEVFCNKNQGKTPFWQTSWTPHHDFAMPFRNAKELNNYKRLQQLQTRNPHAIASIKPRHAAQTQSIGELIVRR